MGDITKPSTIYFEADLHKALQIRAADLNCSVSDLVNDAVRTALAEDEADLASFDERASEPLITYEELVDDLKAHGKV